MGGAFAALQGLRWVLVVTRDVDLVALLVVGRNSILRRVQPNPGMTPTLPYYAGTMRKRVPTLQSPTCWKLHWEWTGGLCCDDGAIRTWGSGVS